MAGSGSVGAYQSRLTRGSSLTCLQRTGHGMPSLGYIGNIGLSLKLPRWFRSALMLPSQPGQRPLSVPARIDHCCPRAHRTSYQRYLVLLQCTRYVYQAGAALWASLLYRPHLPPSHAQTYAHRPVLLHRRSPIVARLVHFSSQCVRGQPTRLKHPCYPIRCIVLSQETALNLSTPDAIIIYNGNLVGEPDR